MADRIGCFVLVCFTLLYFFLGVRSAPSGLSRMAIGRHANRVWSDKKAETKKKGRLAPSFTVVLPFLSLSLSAFSLFPWLRRQSSGANLRSIKKEGNKMGASVPELSGGAK